MANTAIPADWGSIRTSVENGVPFDRVAGRFGVKSWTIRKRAQREGWVLPKDIDVPMSKPIVQKSKPPPIRDKNAAIELIQETWAEKGEAHRRVVFEKAHAAMKAANLPAPATWKEAEIADRMGRKAAGLESGDVQVNNLVIPMGWGAGGNSLDENFLAGTSGEVIDAEAPSDFEEPGASGEWD